MDAKQISRGEIELLRQRQRRPGSCSGLWRCCLTPWISAPVPVETPPSAVLPPPPTGMAVATAPIIIPFWGVNSAFLYRNETKGQHAMSPYRFVHMAYQVYEMNNSRHCRRCKSQKNSSQRHTCIVKRYLLLRGNSVVVTYHKGTNPPV